MFHAWGSWCFSALLPPDPTCTDDSYETKILSKTRGSQLKGTIRILIYSGCVVTGFCSSYQLELLISVAFSVLYCPVEQNPMPVFPFFQVSDVSFVSRLTFDLHLAAWASASTPRFVCIKCDETTWGWNIWRTDSCCADLRFKQI